MDRFCRRACGCVTGAPMRFRRSEAGPSTGQQRCDEPETARSFAHGRGWIPPLVSGLLGIVWAFTMKSSQGWASARHRASHLDFIGKSAKAASRCCTGKNVSWMFGRNVVYLRCFYTPDGSL